MEADFHFFLIDFHICWKVFPFLDFLRVINDDPLRLGRMGFVQRGFSVLVGLIIHSLFGF
jgi:hypothetical protein